MYTGLLSATPWIISYTFFIFVFPFVSYIFCENVQVDAQLQAPGLFADTNLVVG